MTYLATGLVCVDNFIGLGVDGATALKRYTYSTNDLKAVVEGAGYFNDEANRFNIGDQISVSGDIDGTPWGADYIVSSNDGAIVGVTAYVLGSGASSEEIDRVADLTGRIVNLTAATLALTVTDHEGRIVTVNRAAGSTLTLPAATGSGAKFEVIVGTTITSNNLIVQVVGNDIMQGNAILGQDSADTVVLFETAADSDTITMNGTTKGGIKGDRIQLIDIAADTWQVNIVGSATGTEATPFSAAVT